VIRSPVAGKEESAAEKLGMSAVLFGHLVWRRFHDGFGGGRNSTRMPLIDEATRF
jgi:hypothetical protein